MSVFVVGQSGCRLMPVSKKESPFTIKLSYKTGSTTQPGYLGIDTGSQHIGGSVVREDGTVLHKEEISLRDSMTKRKLLEARASLRRGRRYRKTRYRLSIELGRFDQARMKGPGIHGKLYQKGPQYDYENVRACVLDRDRYDCKGWFHACGNYVN